MQSCFLCGLDSTQTETRRFYDRQVQICVCKKCLPTTHIFSSEIAFVDSEQSPTLATRISVQESLGWVIHVRVSPNWGDFLVEVLPPSEQRPPTMQFGVETVTVPDDLPSLAYPQFIRDAGFHEVYEKAILQVMRYTRRIPPPPPPHHSTAAAAAAAATNVFPMVRCDNDTCRTVRCVRRDCISRKNLLYVVYLNFVQVRKRLYDDDQ